MNISFIYTKINNKNWPTSGQFYPSKSSLNKNFKHMDLQKETHTLNKSNQFYISKTSQDSLVSIH